MPIIQSKGSAPLFCTHNIASFQFRNLISLHNNSNNAEIFSGKGEFDLRSYRMFFNYINCFPGSWNSLNPKSVQEVSKTDLVLSSSVLKPVSKDMAFLAGASPTMPAITALRAPARNLKPLKSLHIQYSLNFPKVDVKLKHSPVCCTKLTPWEPSPVSYAPTHESGTEFLEKTTSNIFDSLTSDEKAEALVTGDEEDIDSKNQPFAPFQLLKWTMWILGPTLLLTTGMVPTLWLPLSSIFIGPNIASLLSLIGLDCIFNLGVTLFLLMADSCAQPKNLTKHHSSSPPFQYKFWNMVATVSGFVIPLMLLFGSEKGFLQPQLPFISSAVLLGPYLLLLSVQILTEMLTWHWQSPVWLVTPIVYEAYRVLQLMRGLKLAAELVAPSWMLHMIRGLVSWWILILGVQLMSVAWFAGFTARGRKQLSYSSPDD